MSVKSCLQGTLARETYAVRLEELEALAGVLKGNVNGSFK